MNHAVKADTEDLALRQPPSVQNVPASRNLPAMTERHPAPVTRIGPWSGCEADTVFLHGVLASTAMWRGMSRLHDPLNAIALPLPGHFPWNTSPAATIDLLEDFAFLDEYRARIRELTNGGIRLVAHSTGALVALRMAAHWPDLVDRVVLFGAFACGRKAATRSLMANAVTMPLAGSALFRILYDMWLYSPGLYERGLSTAKAAGNRQRPQSLHERTMLHDLRRSDPESLRAVVRWLQEVSVNDDLGAIRAPVTVVVGDSDPVVNAEEQLRLARTIPKGSAAICKTGHLPMFEAPDMVHRLIAQPNWTGRAN